MKHHQVKASALLFCILVDGTIREKLRRCVRDWRPTRPTPTMIYVVGCPSTSVHCVILPSQVQHKTRNYCIGAVSTLAGLLLFADVEPDTTVTYLHCVFVCVCVCLCVCVCKTAHVLLPFNLFMGAV